MKTVLVTGGSRGIGAQTVRLFAEKGWTVLLNYCKSKQQAEDLQKELIEKGFDVHLLYADLSRPDDVDKMFDTNNRFYHKLDVLVNNAGKALYQQIQDVTLQQYDEVMAVNCRAPFLSCQKASELFLKQGYGSIVNLSSIWGLKGARCESVYSMSKFALIGLTLSLHEEIGDFVNVNCVCPSVVATEMCSHLTDEELTTFLDENGGKLLRPVEVAKAIYDVATSGESGKIIEIK